MIYIDLNCQFFKQRENNINNAVCCDNENLKIQIIVIFTSTYYMSIVVWLLHFTVNIFVGQCSKLIVVYSIEIMLCKIFLYINVEFDKESKLFSVCMTFYIVHYRYIVLCHEIFFWVGDLIVIFDVE